MVHLPTLRDKRWQFWIDRGGTFTDIVAQRPDGSTQVHKLLSHNPRQYEDAPIRGIREIMGLTESEPIPSHQISVVKMGTTVATNALLEREGDRTLFITTQGFRDALRIGYQNRPDIFAQQIVLPEMLYERVIEVRERIAADGSIVRAITPAEEKVVLQTLQSAYDDGIQACAISFVHGYQHPEHERHVAKIAKQVGFTQISVSHQVSPLVKWVSRSDTTVLDAYLSPILRRYIDRIERSLSFQNSQSSDSQNIRNRDLKKQDIENQDCDRKDNQYNRPQVLFMQSNGGLTPAKSFQGKDSILSGPAGGIVGAVQTSLAAGFNKVVTFDMGGTSTDVAHFAKQDDSKRIVYERVLETEVAGVRLRAPMMAIHTVAAGGGSVLGFDGDRYQVGPESAGAYPGPACYRNEGPLTVTDCNVMVGKIQPDFFPQVFGTEGNQPLDSDIVEKKFLELAEKISSETGRYQSAPEIAEGFLEVAVGNMANAIKKISVQKGYDISNYALCCFGAAGGQHACRLAETLGIKTILVHPHAGVLSAYGMGLADRRLLKEKSVELPLSERTFEAIARQLEELEAAARLELKQQGDRDLSSVHVLRQCQLRYAGTDSTLTVTFGSPEAMSQQFENQYRQQYGVATSQKELIVATVTLELVGKTQHCLDNRASPYNPAEGEEILTQKTSAKEVSTVQMYSRRKWYRTPVFNRQDLQTGQQIVGPSIILEQAGTNIIEPGWEATISKDLSLVVTQTALPSKHVHSDSKYVYLKTEQTVAIAPEDLATPDPVRLEIFNNLFQAIAEQMGFTLQNTSSSVNIKERLDFSCAIFDGTGQLVANAPHIPVHLGSMDESVKALIADRKELFHPGDVFISNNPYNGGTHLPDITAITPVFITPRSVAEQKLQPLFFVASRGHHADIGGITPGSMPPTSTSIEQEGILLDNFHIVERGVLKSEALRDHLSKAACPARNPDKNLADLQAQIAANNKGVQELLNMVEQFGLSTVQTYMRHVQDNAERAIRKVIQKLCKQQDKRLYQCSVPMDCGATIDVAIAFDATDNSATIDFSNTSAQQSNNFNAPLSVCKAVVLYVFRTLVDKPIPLNAGCLKPLDIKVPASSMLNPTYPAAVVAGNVETSQAIADALYGALNILAASQGTMNNFTFGNTTYQYYETICGGSGAGPTFNGTDAVQTHMTNSRLTDPEILELRFPVLLEEFSIRPESGGEGQYSGGNGVYREILFRESVTANLLSGRRENQPFGLAGGTSGKAGAAFVKRSDGTREVLSATATVEIEAGDSIAIATPGGGGYGQ